MKNIILTSCGFRDEELKNKFYEIIPKEELINKKVLYSPNNNSNLIM